MREGRVTAIVPVRKGSVRVMSKSTRPFNDTSLLEHKLKQLIGVQEIDKIILTTDSDEAKDIGRRYGVVVLDRTGYYSSSECNNSEFFKHIAEQTMEEDKYLLYTPVTSPFIKSETISDIIRTFKEDESCDSVVPVEIIKHHMWLDGKPLNYDMGCAPNTQDLPNVYALNYSSSIISREHQISYKNLCGQVPRFYPLPQFEAVDIDTMYDFELSQLIYKNKNLVNSTNGEETGVFDHSK